MEHPLHDYSGLLKLVVTKTPILYTTTKRAINPQTHVRIEQSWAVACIGESITHQSKNIKIVL